MKLSDFFHKNDINEGLRAFRSTDGAHLIDVREPEEYRAGHIPGAVNIPVSSLRSIEDEIDDYDAPIFIYCLSGVRAGRAAAALGMIGYTKVRSIGGISDYDGPIEK
ncbi:MAG: rhodanese-like domain-containing protein [Clostridia bacterium]|nr:rhodanese-like domain-containing protein [Clostridia bacterium]